MSDWDKPMEDGLNEMLDKRILIKAQAARIAALEAAVTQCRTLSAMLKPQADRIAELEKDRDELQAVLNKCWEADQRAIKAWQEAHPGKDLVWPDRTKLAVWLLEKGNAASIRIAELESALATARRDAMEEAAKISDSCAADWAKSAKGKYLETKWDYESRADAGEEIAAAIRAALEGGKKDEPAKS